MAGLVMDTHAWIWLVLDATLLTRDRRILAYGAQGRVPTMRA